MAEQLLHRPDVVPVLEQMGMVFMFYRNASGLFAAVEGGPKVMAALPAALKGKRARHCDPR